MAFIKLIKADLSDKELQKIHEEYRYNDLLLGLDKNNNLIFKAMDSGWKVRLPGNSFNTQKEAYEWYKENYNKIMEWLDKDSERDHTLFSKI